MHAPEEVHVVRRLERPCVVISAERAFAADIERTRDEKAELRQGKRVQPQGGGDRVARDRAVVLIRGDRDEDQLDEVV